MFQFIMVMIWQICWFPSLLNIKICSLWCTMVSHSKFSQHHSQMLIPLVLIYQLVLYFLSPQNVKINTMPGLIVSWPCRGPASFTLFLPTLCGKRGIFTRSPWPWVYCPLSFLKLSCCFPCSIAEVVWDLCQPISRDYWNMWTKSWQGVLEWQKLPYL